MAMLVADSRLRHLSHKLVDGVCMENGIAVSDWLTRNHFLFGRRGSPQKIGLIDRLGPQAPGYPKA